MAYLVNQTNGTLLSTILDGQTDTVNSSLVLIGKQVVGYGEIQNENFVHLLENFSNASSPPNPLEGQLWWNSTANVMNTFDGTQWRPLTGFTSAATSPVNSYIGDQWWDTTNDQYKIYNGTGWVTVGPAYSKLDSKSGAIVENLYDTVGAKHTVINLYHNNSITAIVSRDAAFTPNVAIAGFSTVRPGISFTSQVNAIKFYGTATNADTVSNIAATQFLRNDTASVTNSRLSVQNQLFVGDALELNLSSDVSSNATVKNTVSNKNLSLNVSVGGQPTDALVVNGTTGLVTVASAPTTAFGVATKGYADYLVASLRADVTDATVGYIATNVAIVNNSIAALRANITAANVAIATIGSNYAPLASPTFTGVPLSTTPAHLDSSTKIATTAFIQGELAYYAKAADAGNAISDLNASLRAALAANVSAINANVAAVNANVTAANARIVSLQSVKANIDSPTFTGTVYAPTPASNSNNTEVATTEFVKSAVGSFSTTSIYSGTTSASVTNSAFSVKIGGSEKIAITSSGVTLNDTVPAGDSSTKIATTAFVQNASKFFTMTNGATKYQPVCYVSNSAPSNSTGNDGDIWFQYT